MSVSVVIPCRDGAATLAQTIGSALSQTAPPDEVVVIDDGSSDGSRAVAERFGPRVSVHPGPERGAAAARSAGAGLASGERLMFLDADDLLTPRTLAALGATLDGAHGPAFALCPWDRLEREGDAWLVRPPSAAPRRPGQDDLAAWLTGAWSPPCAVLWDRAALDRAGGWGEEAATDDDGRLVMRALARGVPLRRARAGLALYRRAPIGASLSGRRFTAQGLASRIRTLEATRAELVRAGRLDAYRAALAEAAGVLLRDAEGHPEIAARCRALVGATRAPRLRPALGRVMARGRDGLADRLAAPRAALASKRPAPARPAGGAEALVSVVIPTRDRPEATERAARSVLAQTHRALECLVIDDGSRDDTAARAEAIGDARLRVVCQANGGVARARNRGLAEARGTHIAFLDSDDAWRPEKLARQFSALAAAPAHVGLCVTGAEIRPPRGTPEIRRAGPGGDLFETLLLRNVVHAPTSCLLARREVVEAVGGFDPSLPAIEDWEWLQRAARLFDLAAVDEPLVVYADHDRDGPRRSRDFAANMEAREMLWQRNRHALRRIRAAHLFLLESARRELREPEGRAARGRSLVLRALAERPAAAGAWPWLGYMLAPRAGRAWLRTIDAPRHARRQALRRPVGP